MKKTCTLFLAALMLCGCLILPASAKTNPAGQTVGAVLFYVTNKDGDEILVAQLPVSELEADMKSGKIDTTLHNYSLLDKFVTTVHQEAQGFTVPDFIAYAQSKSPIAALRSQSMLFSGKSTVSFWEIDQTGYDELDTYTYADLYDTPRFNYPLLYKYWDYTTQDYCDPDGKMTRAEVIDYIYEHREPETVLLSVRAFSQRYIVTDEMFGQDYNMEGYWHSRGLLDNERTIRVMKPMTKQELYNKAPTAADSRYWTANILLTPENAPNVKSLGTVASPTAVMTEDKDNYYITFSCATDGATILYNHNYISPSYTPTSPYGDGAVVVPKSEFPGGTVTMTARAVKEGYADTGVVTLKLTASGAEYNAPQAFTDVSDTAWYADAVKYVMLNGLFDLTGKDTFSPDAPMTRAMLAEALYRLDGSPSVTDSSSFTDSAAPSVIWANKAGVVNGMGDGIFAPDAGITREQIAAMLYRYAVYAGMDVSARGNLDAFTDKDKISEWALNAIIWANGVKLINGMGDGTLSPQGSATRAQVAQILLNFAG